MMRCFPGHFSSERPHPLGGHDCIHALELSPGGANATHRVAGGEGPMGSQRKLLVLTAAVIGTIASVMIGMITPVTATAAPPSGGPNPTRLVTGLEGASGSTVGPGGALYVTEGAAGRISRVDPKTGDITTFASGLPPSLVGFGGAMDVAFIGHTAYVLVTLVGPDVGGSSVVGLYRVDGPDSFTVVANIGAFAIANPPATDFFVPSGVQYALQTYRGRLLVTDGHHNRVLRVTRDGAISELRAFGNIVPTGLDVRGRTIYMAQAGPSPTCPRTARWWRSGPTRPPSGTWPLAAACRWMWSSAPGIGCTPLSQGVFPPGNPVGSPALPNTGALVRAHRDGTVSVV